MTNRMWGGRFVSGPAEIMEEINASIGFDKRLAPHDIRGSLAHAAMLGAAGILPHEDVTAIERGLKAIAAEIESGAFTFSRALEDIHMNVEQRLARPHRPVGGAAPHRALAQRPGRDRYAALGARRDRRPRRAARRAADGARREGARLRVLRHAGLHASAAGAAGDLRPPSPRLRRDARPRPRALRRRAPAPQRVPARRRGARRHVVPDRPLHDRGGARLRPADRELPRFRLRPRFRARDACRGLDLRRAPLAVRRGDRALDDAAVRLRAALRRASPPAPRSCRRSATPTRPSSCAARPAGSSAPCRRSSSS